MTPDDADFELCDFRPEDYRPAPGPDDDGGFDPDRETQLETPEILYRNGNRCRVCGQYFADDEANMDICDDCVGGEDIVLGGEG